MNLGGDMETKEYDYRFIEGVEIAKAKMLRGRLMVRWLHKEETKGGVILPQNRQRAHFGKGQVLAIGDDCKPLMPGQFIQFDAQCEKTWIGEQNPAGRDTVFVMDIERVYGTISRDAGDNPVMDMIRDHILLRPDPHPSEVRGFIVTETIQENERRRAQGWQGTVLRTGEKVDSCVPGDRIAYETSYAAPLKMGDHNAETCIIIQDRDVVGILEVA